MNNVVFYNALYLHKNYTKFNNYLIYNILH